MINIENALNTRSEHLSNICNTTTRSAFFCQCLIRTNLKVHFRCVTKCTYKCIGDYAPVYAKDN